ncbi:hypothetical protein VKT23_018484 [Stygiomarasmius scandens]|uniref:Uncharacterized protein n=1 Tax=Marasmiellus scandens TaxID=2682957 RepID=A0ABR1IP78_9AGAR
MSNTAFSLFHTLLQDDVLTNTSHTASRKILALMFISWCKVITDTSEDYFLYIPRAHYPDLHTVSGLSNLLHLTNIIQFGSFLWLERYQNASIDPDDIQIYQDAQHHANNLLVWFDKSYYFRGHPLGHHDHQTIFSFKSLQQQLFVKQAAALFRGAHTLQTECSTSAERVQLVTCSLIDQFFRNDFDGFKKQWSTYTQNVEDCPTDFLFTEIMDDAAFSLVSVAENDSVQSNGSGSIED